MLRAAPREPWPREPARAEAGGSPPPAAVGARERDPEAGDGPLSELSPFRRGGGLDWCKVQQWALAASVGGAIICEAPPRPPSYPRPPPDLLPPPPPRVSSSGCSPLPVSGRTRGPSGETSRRPDRVD